MMPEDYEEFISFDPEDNEIKETVKNARKKLETPNGSRYALQDMQREQKWGNP